MMNYLLDKLNEYPHLQKKLDIWWGTSECRSYLAAIIMSDRHNRNGFPFQTAILLQDLIELHDKEYPKYAPAKTVWDDYI